MECHWKTHELHEVTPPLLAMVRTYLPRPTGEAGLGKSSAALAAGGAAAVLRDLRALLLAPPDLSPVK